MGGCYIDSRGQGIVGETVNFKVHLPTGPWVSLQGELIHQDWPIGFGVNFKRLTEGDQKILMQVVAAHGGEAAAEQLVREENELQLSAPRAPESRRIIVADDDALTLRMLTAIVETQGHTVVPAEDGRAALEILQNDANFSAAIFDMMMPHLHGLDLIRFMKTDERLQGIPIGMVTAEQDPKIWDDSIVAGASVFLPKPFTPPQVQMMLLMLFSKGARQANPPS